MHQSIRSPNRVPMRLIPLLITCAGCGYGSYYPQPSGRNGQAIAADTMDSNWPCSDLASMGQWGSVQLTVTATEPVLLYYIDGYCTETLLMELASGRSWLGDSHPLAVYASRSPDGAPLDWFQVPAEASGPWSETAP